MSRSVLFRCFFRNSPIKVILSVRRWLFWPKAHKWFSRSLYRCLGLLAWPRNILEYSSQVKWSKMTSDAVSSILSMTTDQIVNNYTLWSTNCPRAEHFIAIAKTSRGSFELTKDIAIQLIGMLSRSF